MKHLYRRHNIGLIIIIATVSIFSSCVSNNIVEKETIKVIEESSTVQSQSKEITKKKNILSYYNSYKVNLEVDPQTRVINGVEKISYKNTTDNDLNNIYFNLYLNAFSSDAKTKPYFGQFESKIFKYGRDTGSINIKSVHINNENTEFEQNTTILKVDLSKALKVGEETEITLQFDSYIPKIAHRTGANDKAMWLGNYLPILCKYENSEWRQDLYYPAGDPFYSDISNYEVKVTTPKEYDVIGTGDEIITEVGEKKITILTAEMVRDFAFAISKNYTLNTIKTQDGINLNFYHYSDDTFNINELLSTAEKGLKYYSDMLGNYPYAELDIIESDLFLNSGGMEYPAFIMMDSSYLKNQSSLNSIVHEVGHQWFYNIIGSDQINEAWLDEGLNSYLQEKILYSDSELDKKLNAEYVALETQLKNLQQKTLNLSLNKYSDWASYYNTQYIRSKLMIYSLNKKIGDELFNTFLKTYYKKYAFKIVTVKEFITTIEEIYGNDMTYWFDKWIENNIIPQLD